MRLQHKVFLALFLLLTGCAREDFSPQRGDVAAALYGAWCDNRQACGQECDVPTLWGTYCQEHDCEEPVCVGALSGCLMRVRRLECEQEYEPKCMAEALDQLRDEQ